MSVIAFFCPAMCKVVRGDTCFCFILKASALSNSPATSDPFAAMRRTQLTVGELSLNKAMCAPGCGLHTSSITSHNSRRPAHSRSEFVNLPPCPLFVRRTSCFMSSGHSSQKTVGTHSCLLPTTTPPTPWMEASFTPTKSVSPITNSLHGVGFLVASRNKSLQSLTTCSNCLFL